MRIKTWLWIILSTVVGMIVLFSACSRSENSDSLNPNVEKSAVVESSTLDVNTITELQKINQNLVSANAGHMGTRSGWFDGVKIGLADARGAFVGFCRGGFGGAVIGAAIYSLAAFLVLCTQQNDQPTTNTPFAGLTREKIECVYSNVDYTPEVGLQISNQCNDINIELPRKYDYLTSIGVKHNATLYMYSDTYTGSKLRRELSSEEETYLNSDGYKNYYDNFLKNAEVMLSKSISDYDNDELINCTENQKTIVKLFFSGCESTTNTEDINYLINSYIPVIEQDNALSDTEKESLYATMVTFAYSSSYWNQHISDYAF